MKSRWQTKTLGEVCSFLDDGDWIEAKDQANRGIRLIQTGNIGEGIFLNRTEKSHFITEQIFLTLHCEEVFPGDILISRLPEPIGRACIVPDIQQRMITAVDCSIARLDEKKCLKKFFVYFSQSSQYIFFIKQHCTGTTRSRISRKNLANIQIPLPSLEEQKRIVGILDSAFEKIDAIRRNAEQNLANAKELFQRILDEEMTPHSGWKSAKIRTFADVKIGPFGSLLHKNDYVINGIPIVNPCHMKNNILASEIVQQISHSKAQELSSYELKTNDIVFARRGEIGRCVLITPQTAGYLCGTGSLFIRIRKDVLAPFLFLTAQSKTFVSALEKMSTGTTMSSINVNSISNMEVAFPSFSQQQKILDQLESIRNLFHIMDEQNTQYGNSCIELKQQILAKAFRGEF